MTAIAHQTIQYTDWGTIEYGDAWDRQEAVLAEGLRIKREAAAGADLRPGHQLFLCTHPHVYTLGKSGHIENLLASDIRLQELGASFYKTNRGGDITYHGPGQVVGYPVFDLEQFYTDIGRYMRALEEVIIQTIALWGIRGDRMPGATGVWLDADSPAKARKICAMGVRCSRWMTMHGFALNVNTDLSYFGYIVPCGITDKGVTSMAAETGGYVNEDDVKDALLQAFSEVFNASIVNA